MDATCEIEHLAATELLAVAWPVSEGLFPAERLANELSRFCVVEARDEEDPPGVESHFVVVPMGLVGSVADGREVVLVADDDVHLTRRRELERHYEQRHALQTGLALTRQALACLERAPTDDARELLERLAGVLEADGSS